MAAGPNFAGNSKTETLKISAANTNRDGSGTIVYSTAVPATGRTVARVRFAAEGTVTAGNVRMFIDDGTGGAGHARMWDEQSCSAAVPSATVLPTMGYFEMPAEGIALQSGYRLGFATNNAEAYDVTIIWGDN